MAFRPGVVRYQLSDPESTRARRSPDRLRGVLSDPAPGGGRERWWQNEEGKGETGCFQKQKNSSPLRNSWLFSSPPAANAALHEGALSFSSPGSFMREAPLKNDLSGTAF